MRQIRLSEHAAAERVRARRAQPGWPTTRPFHLGRGQLERLRDEGVAEEVARGAERALLLPHRPAHRVRGRRLRFGHTTDDVREATHVLVRC